MNLFDREYPMPASLKEVLGSRQSVGALLCIGLITTLAAVLWWPVIVGELESHSLWRVLLAGLLMLDIAAGAVANFTPGTSAFYARRPGWLWGFIAIHVHLPVVGWLLGWPLAPLAAVWLYTIAAACLVNLCFNRPWQPVLAGTLLCGGVLMTSALSLPPGALAVSLLFMLKVLYAFAVNHYPERSGGSS